MALPTPLNIDLVYMCSNVKMDLFVTLVVVVVFVFCVFFEARVPHIKIDI